MPSIRLKMFIEAPKEVVFDLSRSIDLHKISTKHTKEEAIAGKTSGLLGNNEWVTWRAKHLGIRQKLTSKITVFDFPNYFVDEMVQGAFKFFRHEHHFKTYENGTVMKDIFTYRSPFGILGHIVDFIFLKCYMKRLLQKRNTVIKQYAESGQWKEI